MSSTAATDKDLSRDSGNAFLDLLETIGAEDAAGLKKAAESYGNSWKSRGGVGAFMMLARKWDRLQNRLNMGLTEADKVDLRDVISVLEAGKPELMPGTPKAVAALLRKVLNLKAYDIFHHIAVDQRAEGVIDDVRDLRRYLMLVEAEMRARGFDATHRDNK